MRDMNEVAAELNKQIQLVVDAARVVTIMDGTDRDSLDDLRNALYKLGKLKIEFDKYFDDDEIF
jgi:hypothetical protein